MSERAKVIAVTVALAILAGIWGFQAGRPLSDTEIIERVAAAYVENAGPAARLTDCAARPDARASVRLVVICENPDTAGAFVEVSPRGIWTYPGTEQGG